MAYLKLVTPPTTEPVTLAQAKATLRVDFADDDARITRHIQEAREWVERRIQQNIAGSTYEMALDKFPAEEIDLPLAPVQSVTSIVYNDVDDVEQTILPADYSLNDIAIYPATEWPAAFDRANSVRVRFVVGYSATNLIPAPVIAAIYLQISQLYDGENREEAIHDLLTNYYTMVA